LFWFVAMDTGMPQVIDSGRGRRRIWSIWFHARVQLRLCVKALKTYTLKAPAARCRIDLQSRWVQRQIKGYELYQDRGSRPALTGSDCHFCDYLNTIRQGW